MSSYRYFVPLAVLVGLSILLGVLLIELAIVAVPAESPRWIRTALMLLGGIASAAVAVVALHWCVVAPLHSVLHVIYRMSEGDFAQRTETGGVGVTAEIADAVDDLAGLLEARWGAAHASERRYRHLFEASPAALFRTRADGRVLDCNLAAVELLGYGGVVDLKTRNARSFYADPAERDLIVERLARGETLRNVEVRLRRKDGREFAGLMSVIRTEEAGETCFEGQLVDAGGLDPGGLTHGAAVGSTS